MTPILPYPIDSLSDGTVVVPVSELNSVEAVSSLFNGAYPETISTDACVVQVDDTVHINNSHENKYIAQDLFIVLDDVGTLSDTMQPHSYLIAKLTSQRL